MDTYKDKNKRVAWLDIGKGICMLFILSAHTKYLSYEYCHFFRAICLPFFFFVSGYVFSLKYNFKEFLKNKIKHLLIPMFSLSLISIVLSQAISVRPHSFVYDVLSLFLQNHGQASYMWFVACLFLAEIIFYFIVKYLNRKLCIVVCILGLLTSIVYFKLSFPSLPWHIQSMGASIFFILIGYEYRANEEKIQKYINSKMLMVSLVFI